MTKRFQVIICCLLAFFLISSSAGAVDAQSLFMEMAEKLAGNDFSVSMFMSYDAVQESGQKIEFSERRIITIMRPNHLRAVALQSDGDKHLLVFDGKVITLFSETENVYSRIEHAGTVDEAIRYAGGNLGIRIPLARMLLTALPEELKKLNLTVQYVERDTLSSPPTDHLAARSDDVDLQVWIAEDKLPRRIVLTYKNAEGQPQFRANFSNWNLEPKISKTAFSFTPPEGAEKIPALLPGALLKAGKNEKGGAK